MAFNYRISSDKRPGASFLQGLQDPALKRDQAFIRDPALISYRLFLIAYFEGTVDVRRSLAVAHLRAL